MSAPFPKWNTMPSTSFSLLLAVAENKNKSIALPACFFLSADTRKSQRPARVSGNQILKQRHQFCTFLGIGVKRQIEREGTDKKSFCLEDVNNNYYYLFKLPSHERRTTYLVSVPEM